MDEKKEYIERGKLISRLEYYYSHTSGDIQYAYAVALKEVRSAPAADMVEVVHGEWKKLRGMAPPEYHGKHICSECGRKAGEWKMHEILTDYCPHCGAKMNGGKHETD